MNSRKLYLSFVSGCLIGFGAFILLHERMLELGALSISIALALGSTAALYSFSAHLAGRSARALVGLALVFGAICFGAQNGGLNLPFSVLWAGVLFGALDSLGKLGLKGSVLISPVGQDSVS